MAQETATKAVKRRSTKVLKKIPMIDIAKIDVESPLGQGGFATVYKINDTNGQLLAMKHPNVNDVDYDEDDLLKEIKIAYTLSHSPFICKLFGICKYKKVDINPCFELCAMDVDTFIKIISIQTDKNQIQIDDEKEEKENNSNGLSYLKYIEWFVYCLAEGLKHMHSRDIAHRDIKPENLLLGSDGNIKIADHGLAKKLGSGLRTWCGTDYYMSYEIATVGKNVYGGASADMWSVGVCVLVWLGNQVYELLSKEFKVDEHFKKWGALYARIIKLKEEVKDVCGNSRLSAVLDSTLILVPTKRDTASGLLKAHFKNFKGNRLRKLFKKIGGSVIDGKKSNPKIGKNGFNLCICAAAWQFVSVQELMASKDNIIKEYYRKGVECDGCRKVFKSKVCIYHCENTISHCKVDNNDEIVDEHFYDYCERCTKQRNDKLKRNWKK